MSIATFDPISAGREALLLAETVEADFVGSLILWWTFLLYKKAILAC